MPDLRPFDRFHASCSDRFIEVMETVMHAHHAVFLLTLRETMLQSIHTLYGGVKSMNAIASALEQIQTEIQRVRDYLEQLEETEREMAKLVVARERILGDLPTEQAPPANHTSQQLPENARPLPQSQPPLPFDILKVLSTAGHPMSFAQLQQDLEEIRGPVQKNALSSTLSRLIRERRVRRTKPGRYAIVTPKNVSEEAATLRKNSIPSIAYAILQEAGKPLTDEEIWSLAKARNPTIKLHSVRGSLYNNAKSHRIFKLTSEKTFGLLEWQNQRGDHPESLTDTEGTPPIEVVVGESRNGGSAIEESTLFSQSE
jgi:hypothetical protein